MCGALVLQIMTINESPVLLLLDTDMSRKHKDLPVSLFESGTSHCSCTCGCLLLLQHAQQGCDVLLCRAACCGRHISDGLRAVQVHRRGVEGLHPVESMHWLT